MSQTKTASATAGSNWPTEFPPPLILEWVQYGAVNADNLVAELRAWADWIDVVTSSR